MVEPLQIGFVLFPNVTQLDFTGPLQILSRLPGAEVHLIASSLDPVPTDAVLTLNPTVTFADCPPLDIICIPGGFGTDQAVTDETLIEFVRREGARARYVTSVCTGAFVLGAAGILKGKKATTHWAYHAELARVGAIPTKERVVRDGNIFTGGGVTAGIDFALTLAAMLGDAGHHCGDLLLATGEGSRVLFRVVVQELEGALAAGARPGRLGRIEGAERHDDGSDMAALMALTKLSVSASIQLTSRCSQYALSEPAPGGCTK